MIEPHSGQGGGIVALGGDVRAYDGMSRFSRSTIATGRRGAYPVVQVIGSAGSLQSRASPAVDRVRSGAALIHCEARTGQDHCRAGARRPMRSTLAALLALGVSCSPAPPVPVPEPVPAQADEAVPVQDRYGSTIVYGVNPTVPVDRLRADCERRGGTLNTCGSPCPPEADVCAQVCAVTCEGVRPGCVE